MQTRITIDEMTAAARHLAKTENGRRALQRMLELWDDGGLDLDLLDRHAFLALLGGAWSGHADEMRNIVNQAIAAQPHGQQAAD
jgi:hypothetical protein